MARKLDRVLVNFIWLQAYESSRVEFLSPGESDHCLALVQLSQVVNSPSKPFNFFNFWFRHSEFMEIVKVSW